MRHIHVKILVLVVLVFVIGSPAMAQTSYPNKPVRIIVPMPPGGSNDLLARTLGKNLSDVVKQAVVIDNRAGAGGEIGCVMAANAEPDGYTLLLASLGAMAHNPASKPNLAYNPVRDFAAVTNVATSTLVVLVTPSLPAKNVKELIALAKAKPGVLNYASSGVGSSMHLTAEYFKYVTGTDITHVPYKGGAPAMTELIAGQTQLCFIPISGAVIGHVKSGKLRAIAVTSAKRSAAMPDVPTVAESGVEGFAVDNWQGIVAPRQTPPAIVQQMNQYIAAAVKRANMVEWMNSLGLESAISTPEAFSKLIAAEIATYTKVVKAANLKF